jgi:Skp family chaperone for outer membrane proteins
MKLVGMIFCLLISLTAFSHPRDSVRAAHRDRARIERKSNRIAEKERARAEKEVAKMEREREQIMRKWDQRTMEQKRNDRQALFFLAVCAGFLVHAMAHHE